MYYIWLDENNKIKETLLQGYHEKVSEEKLSKAILMENLPNPSEVEGKYVEVYVNTDTKEYRYEYHDVPEIPLSEEEQRLRDIEDTLMNLMLTGGNL